MLLLFYHFTSDDFVIVIFATIFRPVCIFPVPDVADVPVLSPSLQPELVGLKYFSLLLSSAVVTFTDVYMKSVCQPRDLLVDVFQEHPEDTEHMYIPSCVVLKRCGGCCNDEAMECVPTESRNATLQVRPARVSFVGDAAACSAEENTGTPAPIFRALLS